MRRALSPELAFLLFCALFLLAACRQREPVVLVGDPFPGISLESLEGEKVTLPDAYEGNLVVILFWEAGCASCKEEMPRLEGLYRKYGGEGVLLVALNVGDTREAVAAAVSAMNITYPVLLDPGEKTKRKCGIRSIPAVFVLDRDGRVTEKVHGLSKMEDLEGLIRERH
jgi:peroxiredoxin